MPRHEFEEYYSKEELANLVSLLNAFAIGSAPWHRTKARKQHEDIFGETIQPGDDYYKFHHGIAFDDVIKVSILSMERLCFVLFESAHTLKSIAEKIKKQRQEAFAAQLDSIKLPGI